MTDTATLPEPDPYADLSVIEKMTMVVPHHQVARQLDALKGVSGKLYIEATRRGKNLMLKVTANADPEDPGKGTHAYFGIGPAAKGREHRLHLGLRDAKGNESTHVLAIRDGKVGEAVWRDGTSRRFPEANLDFAESYTGHDVVLTGIRYEQDTAIQGEHSRAGLRTIV